MSKITRKPSHLSSSYLRITIGAFISQICDGKKYLDWLLMGATNSFQPKTSRFRFSIFKLAFGFTLKVTIAQIFTVILSILLLIRPANHYNHKKQNY